MEKELFIEKQGNVGCITLNRPKALNALTYDMCLAIEEAMINWLDDDEVQLLLIDAVGEKAFCAGGDVAKLYKNSVEGNFEYGRNFWRDEYRLNAFIANYPMPECSIGIIPDVGGSKILADATGSLGEYLAMTGHRMNSGDAVLAGFADVQVASSDLDALKKEICEDGNLTAIAKYGSPPDIPTLRDKLDLINHHFSQSTAVEIVKSLEASEDEWCQKAAQSIRRADPLAISCTLEVVRRSRELETLEEVLELEYRFSHRSLSKGDMIEGIRAQIIDKDRNPNWKIATLEEVTDQHVEDMLAPIE